MRKSLGLGTTSWNAQELRVGDQPVGNARELRVGGQTYWDFLELALDAEELAQEGSDDEAHHVGGPPGDAGRKVAGQRHYEQVQQVQRRRKIQTLLRPLHLSMHAKSSCAQNFQI